MNSPRKTHQHVVKLQHEIKTLKATVKQQKECIQCLERELCSLKTTQSESNEYEEYAKKQLMRNVEILSKENSQLREEIEKYKSKVTKMMKLLYNMSKKGISVDVMVDCAEEDINDGNINHVQGNDDIQILETQMSNLSSTTFTPLNMPDDEKVLNMICHTHLPSNGVVPKLNLEQFQQHKYNDNCLSNKMKHNNNHHHNNSHEVLVDAYTVGNNHNNANISNNNNNNNSFHIKNSNNNSFINNNGITHKQLNKSVNYVNNNNNNNNNKIKLMTLNATHHHHHTNTQTNNNNNTNESHKQQHNSLKSGGSFINNNKNK